MYERPAFVIAIYFLLDLGRNLTSLFAATHQTEQMQEEVQEVEIERKGTQKGYLTDIVIGRITIPQNDLFETLHVVHGQTTEDGYGDV